MPHLRPFQPLISCILYLVLKYTLYQLLQQSIIRLNMAHRTHTLLTEPKMPFWRHCSLSHPTIMFLSFAKQHEVYPAIWNLSFKFKDYWKRVIFFGRRLDIMPCRNRGWLAMPLPASQGFASPRNKPPTRTRPREQWTK